MGLVYKKLEKIGRSMYLYFPEQENTDTYFFRIRKTLQHYNIT